MSPSAIGKSAPKSANGYQNGAGSGPSARDKAEEGITPPKARCSDRLMRVSSFNIAEDIGAFEPTKIISSGQVCADGSCDGFALIKCGE
jgi:hypothetical protein